MRYRSLTLAVVCLLALSGCVSFSSPPTATTTSVEDSATEVEKATPNGDGTMSPGEVWYNLEREDAETRLDVTSARMKDNTFELTYVSETQRRSTFNEEVARVAFIYSTYVNDTDEPAEELVVNVTDEFGDVRMTYTVERQWAQAVQDGDVTPREYAYKVFDENGIPRR